MMKDGNVECCLAILRDARILRTIFDGRRFCVFCRGRAAKLARLTEFAAERAALEKEYETLKELDPQVMADLEKELELVTQAANRWTDNIFNCQSYLVKKRGMEKKQVVWRFC